MGEWKRFFNYKMLLIILVAVILNLAFFVYGQMSGRNLADTVFSNQEYQWLVERYRDLDLNQAMERSTKELSAIVKFVKESKPSSETSRQSDFNSTDSTTVLPEEIDEGCEEILAHYQRLSATEQVQLKLQLKQIKVKITHLIEYPEGVKQIISNASNMKKFKLFSKPDSFSYNNILRTGQDFERVKDVTLSLDNDRAVDAFIHYYFLYYIAFAVMVAIIYGLFKERENGMWCIVHGSASGRSLLAIKRLFLLITSSFVITGLLYGSTMIASLTLYGGWTDLSGSVHTLNDFTKFTYVISKLRFVANNFILSWFIILALSILLWMLFTFLRNRNHTLIFTAAFIGVELLLYNNIQVQSVYNAFKYINIMNLFRISEKYSGYLNWGFGIHVYSVLGIIIVAMTMVLILSSLIAVVRYAIMRPSSKLTFVARIFAALHQKYQKIFTYFPVTIKEIHKLVITGKGLWVVVSMFIIAIYFSGTGKMMFSDNQITLDQMYIEHGGEEYSYISSYIDEKLKSYEEAKQLLKEATEKYNIGEIDLQTYSKALANFDYYRMGLGNVAEFRGKIDYLQQIKEKYDVEGYLISDRGYEEIFGKYSRQRELILMLTLVIGIMLIVSECIAMEYRTGMEDIVRTCERGRNWIFRRKIFASVIFTIAVCLIVYGIDIWNLYHIYGMPFLDAPVMSLSFMEGRGLHISILGWMIILFFIRLLVCLGTMVIAICVSRLIGKKGNRALVPLAIVCVIAVVVLVHSMGGIL